MKIADDGDRQMGNRNNKKLNQVREFCKLMGGDEIVVSVDFPAEKK